MINLSIIIPCYNEGDNIKLLVDKLNTSFKDQSNLEIILVDNGSTDHTLNEINSAINLSKVFIRCVQVKQNKGYGYGILAGLNEAKGKVLAWTHADLQTEPTDVLTAYTLLKQHPNKNLVIKGNRKNRQLLESFFTKGMQWVTYFYLKTNLHDINAQPKCFTKSFFNIYIKPNAPHDFSLDLFLLFQAKKHGKILDFDVFFNKRLYGEAKGGGGSNFKTRLKLIKRTLTYIKELSKKL